MDAQLVALLARRRALVEEVATLKAQNALPALDVGREAAMRAQLHRLGETQGVPPALLDAVLDAILQDSHGVVTQRVGR